MDEKTEKCVYFILERLQIHEANFPPTDTIPPLFVGLNGIQGSGKSYLNILSSPPYHLRLVVLSIDDLYLTHNDQTALRKSHPDNPLIQARGQPSTHDLKLGKTVFESLKANCETKIPQYNKSAFEGQGDRLPEDSWNIINQGKHKIQVVLFEGWCVGFKALPDEVLREAWEEVVRQECSGKYNGILGYCNFEHVKFVNDSLRAYDDLTVYLDAFIQLDAQDIKYVYTWRQEQERALWKLKGCGMTEKQVARFVDMYYPSYELYIKGLRRGIFTPGDDRQLILTLDVERRMVYSERV